MSRLRKFLWKTSLLLHSALVCTFAVEAEAAPTPADARSAEEELLDAALTLDRARGLEAYVALREIWGQWEKADPKQVEALLRRAAQSPKYAEPVRIYAEILSAYARIRRGDLDSARRTFHQLGFVRDWLVLGPFDNEGKAGLERQEMPELEPAAPIVPGRAYSGKERPIRFRPIPDVFPYAWVDAGALLRPSTHICGLFTTFLEGGERPRNITLWAGATGAHRIDFNGETVLEDAAYRRLDIARRSTTVRLLPGVNRLSVKVCGAELAPVFSVRLGDERGRPDPRLVPRAEVELSASAQAVVEQVLREKKHRPTHPTTLFGPLDEIDRLIKNSQAPASAWEHAARYLTLTEGDDPSSHQARDLAERAVQKQPSVERWLLLAALAEDRNHARRALEQARALSSEPSLALLLAEAALLRTGPSPLSAFPLYDQILAHNPDHLEALQGRAELYNAAGLRQSALALLESAWQRQPHSVLLANMVATQRTSLGWASSAWEAEERYAARRFDDASFLAGRLELALARKNGPAARHWLRRLQEAEPDNLWAQLVAARVHRALGHEERALLELERARTISPEDVGTLRALADLKGRQGKRSEQLELLQEILRIQPQNVDVRQYVEHMEPPEVPADERYARSANDFLKRRHAPAAGQSRRTLRDLTVSTVYENGLSSQFRQVVFQPLTDSAAAFSRQYAFHYQADRQRVQLRGARVYRVDGSIDEAIESGEGAADDPSISMYTSARTFYVQFPRLEPGDVVEARYRIDDVTPRNEFADYYGDIVYFQSDEPVFDAEYVLVTPASRKLHIDAQVPGLKQEVQEQAKQRIYRFHASEVAPIEPEPYMPPWSELLSFVHVSTYPSWDALGAWYWGLVKDQLDLDPETRKLAREITQGKTTEEEKVRAVFGWVVKNTRYVALEFGIYGYKPRRCVQTVARGWGDCKDKATVIVTLLRELGIDAHLVIVRTGMRGDFSSQLASLAPFDHAIAYVPSLNLYLDGTAEYSGTYELPLMDQGARSLLVLDGKAQLVQIPHADPSQNLIERNSVVHLISDGSAKLSLHYQTQGHAAPGWRSRYEAEGTRRERITQDLGREFPGLEVEPGGISTSDLNNWEQAVELQVRGRAPEWARVEGSRLSAPVTLGTRLASQYATLSKRKHDLLVSGFSTRRERVELHLPVGMKIVSKVTPVKKETAFGSYSISWEQKGRQIIVESSLQLNKNRIRPEEYQEFRQFCVEADQALGQRLLLSQ